MECSCHNIAGNRQYREGRGLSRADRISDTSVIPSEEGRSLVNDLHSRGTCFSRCSTEHAKSTYSLSTAVLQLPNNNRSLDSTNRLASEPICFARDDNFYK